MNASDNSSRRVPRIVRAALWLVGGLILAVLLALLVIPTLDGSHSHLFANEASAASKIRAVINLQDQYTAAHGYGGFACDLSLLKPIGEQKFPDYSVEFLSTGVQNGYKFSLVRCGPDANRARVRYQVAAVPVEQGKTGIRAFCADEAGVIWYDAKGSITNCLTARRPIE